MKIGILSRDPRLYSTDRLKTAGLERGHEVHIVDYLRCYMNISAERPQVLYRGHELRFDAIVPRIGVSHTFYGTAVVRQFEVQGVPSANGSVAITRSRDKLRSLQILSREGIGLPVTGFAHSTKDIDGLIQTVGGAPLVVKLLEGTQGIGVVLAETQKAAESVIGAFRQLEADILVQEYVAEAEGADLRCLVVDGRAVATMKRQAPEGDFRSNLHRGGRSEMVEPTAEEQDTAVRAAEVLGLHVAGVDLLRSRRGPVVMEVNSSPGLEGIETTTGVDVAARIIELVERQHAEGEGRR